MMARTQITLDPELQRKARDRATQLGISFAEYVRRLVARDVEAPDSASDPTAVFNLGSSGGSDVASDKDRMVAAALRAEQRAESRRR